ncbi:hypothetical protein CERSUDRAFT_107735 [Gelatoporia subvermispora B]|uniref:Chromosome transmission fidelity protein 8 n=1 Tax=Ceriporiopsis subvermispora (strain B) TaxID=914234 RepID=M2QAJ4_CERS8|nr:hypothetical protein CERSUDRAFT_107735 [Gelatoporia subvermispora B]
MVGTLSVDEATKKPTLLIGHHLLEGKLVNLPKPLAIMQRAPAASTDNLEDDTREGSTNASWNIVAVVKRKMVFSKRPMPMVGKGTPASIVRPPSSRG